VTSETQSERCLAVAGLIMMLSLAAVPFAAAAQPAESEATPPFDQQLRHLRHALVRLPEAAGLACVLALRPRRRGTPRRPPSVIQTQIILGVLGAAVMLIVGSSVARAFGIVGAAGLVRYRAMIDDPEDAAVMLSTLAVGLAAGVGLWGLALFGTGFTLAVLWIIESFEPVAHQTFTLKVSAKDPSAIRTDLETLLRDARLAFELRELSEVDLQYEVKMALGGSTSHVSDLIMDAGLENLSAVEWDAQKDK
jgi:uncharacterized membrane protein YhiD involved in acid resistance